MSDESSIEIISNEAGLDIDKGEELVKTPLLYSVKPEELEEFNSVLKNISDRCLPGQILQLRERALDRFKCISSYELIPVSCIPDYFYYMYRFSRTLSSTTSSP